MVRMVGRGRVGRREFLMAGAAVAALAAVPASRRAAAQAAAPGVLRLGFPADPAGFDPAQSPSGMSHAVIEQVYSTLMSLDAEANPYPDLAEWAEISDDAKVYTFHLRPDVRFHNGDPLTAEDVKFTFDRLRKPDSGYPFRAQVEAISDVKVVDPRTIQFTLTTSTGPFLTYMAFPGSSIVSKKLVESGHDLNKTPIGSGPFKFVSYQPGGLIRFERNPNYYEAPKPFLAGMEFRIFPDGAALADALLSGAIDFCNEVPPPDWARVAASPRLQTGTTEGSRYYWLILNNTVRPMDDPRVRQAIAHAIDRQALVRTAFLGQATPLLGGVIPSWSWAHADLKAFTPGANVARARELLAAAGVPNGFQTSMTIASPFPTMTSMAPILRANLAAVGIRADIQTVEVPRYWEEVWAPSKFDVTMMYWISPLADPDDFVFNNYACGTPVNVQKSCSPQMDALLREAKSATTLRGRADAYKKQQQLSLDEMPIVPLVNALILTAHTPRLKDFEPSRTGFLKALRDARLEA